MGGSRGSEGPVDQPELGDQVVAERRRVDVLARHDDGVQVGVLEARVRLAERLTVDGPGGAPTAVVRRTQQGAAVFGEIHVGKLALDLAAGQLFQLAGVAVEAQRRDRWILGGREDQVPVDDERAAAQHVPRCQASTSSLGSGRRWRAR